MQLGTRSKYTRINKSKQDARVFPCTYQRKKTTHKYAIVVHATLEGDLDLNR